MCDQMQKVRCQVRCPDLQGDRRKHSLRSNNHPPRGQQDHPSFVLIETLNDDENVIGKWREGSCDYASSAAAVECVDYACLLCACYFIALLLLLAPCVNAELSSCLTRGMVPLGA